MSVHFGAGARLTQGAVLNPLANWTIGCWYRLNSYASNFTWGFGLQAAIATIPVIGVDCNETNPGALDVFIFNGNFDAVEVLTGSDTDWVFLVIRHVGGTNDYDVLSMREGDTTLTAHGSVNVGSEEGGWDDLIIGDAGYGDPTNCDVRAFFADQSVMSNADLVELAINYQTYDGSALDYFLPLVDVATASENDGTGGNVIAAGTLVDETDEPVTQTPIAASDLVNTSNTDSGLDTITHTVTMAAGQGLVVFAVHSDNGFTSSSLTCTSQPGGSASPTITSGGADINDPVGLQGYEVFWITGFDTAGSYTFSYSVVDTGAHWLDVSSVKVVGHVDSPSAIVGYAGQAQHNPAAGDTVDSGAPITPTGYPCLMVALSCDSQCSLTPSARDGTWSDHGSGFGFFGFGAGGRIISKRITSGDAQALFSVSAATGDVATVMLVLKEAGSVEPETPATYDAIFFGMNF